MTRFWALALRPREETLFKDGQIGGSPQPVRAPIGQKVIAVVDEPSEPSSLLVEGSGSLEAPFARCFDSVEPQTPCLGVEGCNPANLPFSATAPTNRVRLR